MRCWQAEEAQHLPTESVSTGPCGGAGVGVDGVRAHCGASLFATEGVSVIISRVELRRGLLEAATERQTKPRLFTDVVLDFQIIFNLRNQNLFLGAIVTFLS